MRNKILKPCTIIPPGLYVERSADRQLRHNLEDMGRPGYILVARQMGKTNLLLNIKRGFDGTENTFCYLDVSNFIPDLRTFFRTVIDTCVDSFDTKFGSERAVLAKTREITLELLPHKEHEQELRSLLRASNGKLIICLDEIDALTKTDYSDQVFSLIRSIYFSGRTNFPEFSRLTYVLSGVAEPSEIIKNRSISPFNIGEKIYLEDFSELEFQAFLDKAELALSTPIKDCIYKWAGGNPRITWDLCSAIEESEIQDKSEVAINELVSSLYLHSFDLPPIDHIRSLAETDKEIRQAVMAIHYGKADTITDAIKSRLYLAGITSVNKSGGQLKIKNRIIEEALSEKWLEEIDRKNVSTLDLGGRLLRQKRYAEALMEFEKYETGIISVEHPDIFYYEKGSCQYYLGNYEGALETFDRAPIRRSQYLDLYLAQTSLKGTANLVLGNYKECIELLSIVTTDANYDNDMPKPISYYEACINLSSAHLNAQHGDINVAEDLCDRIIDFLSGEKPAKESSDILEKIECAAHYNLSRIYQHNGRHEQALASINRAIFSARGQSVVTLLIERAEKFESSAERQATLSKCVQICIDENVIVSSTSAERILAFAPDRAAYLITELARFGQAGQEDLDKLIQHLMQPNLAHLQNIYTLSILATYLSYQSKHGGIGRILLPKIAALPTLPGEQKDRHQFLSLTMALAEPEDVLSIGELFETEIFSCETATMSEGDYYAFHRLVISLINANFGTKALDIARKARALYDKTIGDTNNARNNNIERLILEYLEIVSLQSTDSIVSDDSILSLYQAIKTCTPKNPPLYFPDNLQTRLLRSLMSSSPHLFVPKQFQRTEPKIGRNEIVTVKLNTDEIRVGKYKKFEAMLASGEAILVSTPPR